MRPAFGGRWTFALASLPILLFFAICLGWLMLLSLFRPSVYALYVPALTLDNYARIFASPVYLGSLLRSVRLAALSTAITALLGLPIALHICRGAGRLKGWYIAVVAAVLLVTFVVKIYAWQILLQGSGVVDLALRATGLVTRPISLIGTETGVLIGLVYASLPYMILCLVAGLEKIPADIEHAAACSGARPARVLLTITLPLAMPAMVSGALFAFALSVAAFVVPALLGAGRIAMAGLEIQRVSVGLGMSGGNWPLAAALSVLLLAVSALFSLALVSMFSSRRWRLA